MRAKIKSAEDFPKKYSCCDAEVAAFTPYLGREVEVSGPSFYHVEICPFCGFEQTGTKLSQTGTPYGLFVDMLDIDEGAPDAES